MWIARRWKIAVRVPHPRDISFSLYRTGCTLVLWTGAVSHIIMVHFVPLYYMLIGIAIGFVLGVMFNG